MIAETLQEMLELLPADLEMPDFVINMSKSDSKIRKRFFEGVYKGAWSIKKLGDRVAQSEDLLAFIGGDQVEHIRVQNYLWFKTERYHDIALKALLKPDAARLWLSVVKAFDDLRQFLEELLKNNQPD